MNEKEAWKEFIKTGEIDDYLIYCKYRNEEEQKVGKKSKSKWNYNSGK